MEAFVELLGDRRHTRAYCAVEESAVKAFDGVFPSDGLLNDPPLLFLVPVLAGLPHFDHPEQSQQKDDGVGDGEGHVIAG